MQTAQLIAEPGYSVCAAEWITSSAGLLQLAPEWKALLQRSRIENTFQSFEWLSTWWEHWGSTRELAAIAIRDPDGVLVGLAPLHITRSRLLPGLRGLAWIGDEHTGSDYLGVIADPVFAEAAIERVVEAIFEHRSEWDYIELLDSVDDAANQHLCRLLSARMKIERETASVCHYIPLPATFDHYFASVSSNLRSNFRRRAKALDRKGNLECSLVTDRIALELNFPELLRLHRMRFDQRGMDSAFLQRGVPEFHLAALRKLADSGVARLILVRVNGELTAALYGFAAGSTFQFYQCGLHTDWLPMGVGQYMMGKSIEAAIHSGHTEFDFLRGGESYKLQWAKQARHTFHYYAFDDRWRSRAGHLAYRVRDRVRRWRAAVRREIDRRRKPVTPDGTSAENSR